MLKGCNIPKNEIATMMLHCCSIHQMITNLHVFQSSVIEDFGHFWPVSDLFLAKRVCILQCMDTGIITQVFQTENNTNSPNFLKIGLFRQQHRKGLMTY